MLYLASRDVPPSDSGKSRKQWLRKVFIRTMLLLAISIFFLVHVRLGRSILQSYPFSDAFHYREQREMKAAVESPSKAPLLVPWGSATSAPATSTVSRGFKATVIPQQNAGKNDTASQVDGLKFSTIEDFQRAYNQTLRVEDAYLCLKPVSIHDSMDFSNIPTVRIPRNEMDKEILAGNVFPNSTYERSGNRIIAMAKQLSVSILCKKVALLLEQDFGHFFTPCYDFRQFSFPDGNDLMDQEACNDVTTRLASGDHSEIARWIFYFPVANVDSTFLRYHLGIAKGSFMGRSCPKTFLPSTVLQLRSGDVFRPMNPHSGYGQPPLDFYLKAVKLSATQNLTILCQDEKSPLYDALRNYDWRSTNVSAVLVTKDLSFQEVLHLFMCAEIVISGVSTLSFLFSLSSNLQQLYMGRDIRLGHLRSTVNIWAYDTEGRYGVYKKWENSQAQVQEMLNFTGGKVYSVRGDYESHMPWPCLPPRCIPNTW